MGNKLQLVQSPKGDAFSNIVKFMTGNNDGTLVLSPDEEKMLSRLCAADALMRSNKHTSDAICKQLQADFAISEFTALKDLKNAQKLFSQAREINKKYLAHLHLERINADIEAARDRLFYEENPGMPGVKFARTPDAKELAALAKLHDAYNNTLKAAPSDEVKEVLPPPIFIFNLIKGQEIETTLTVEQAMQEADELLQLPGASELYADYEVMQDGDDGSDSDEMGTDETDADDPDE